MKHCLWALAAMALLATGSARAGDIVFKPIDTSKFVVQPSKATATLAGRTISTIGNVAASSIENNGYVKTIMDRYGVRTKTDAVDLALRHLAGQPMTRDEALAMRGAGAILEPPPDTSPAPP